MCHFKPICIFEKSIKLTKNVIKLVNIKSGLRKINELNQCAIREIRGSGINKNTCAPNYDEKTKMIQ